MTFAAGTAQIRSNARTRHGRAAGRTTALINKLRATSDICIAIAVLIVPLLSAAMQEVGNALFVSCTLVIAAAWAIEYILEPSGEAPFCGAEVIVAGAIALVVFQLVPLSPTLLQKFSPFSSEYLTLWGTPEGRILGDHPWQTISMTPALTRSGLVLTIGYGLFFLTLLQRLQTLKDIDRLLRLIAVGAAVMAVIGIAQLLTGTHLFLWLFEHPFRSAAWPAKGSFSNQNHFAHFLALGLGPLFWCWRDLSAQNETVMRGSVQTRGFAVRRSTDTVRRACLVAIGLVLLAGVLSFSRGGTIAIAISALISLRLAVGRWRDFLKLTVPMTFFVGLAVWMFGTDLIQEKFRALRTAGSVEEALGGRFALWSAILNAFPMFPVAGSGLGSHAEIYPTWLEQDFGVRFSHAECGYLQVLLELGIVGISLLAAGILLTSYWLYSASRHGDESIRLRVMALAAAVVVSVLHSLVDFVWYIPGCMIVTLAVVASLCRLSQLARPAKAPSMFRFWPACMAWLIILMLVPVSRLAADVAGRDALTEEHWNLYRKHAIKAKDQASFASLETLDDQLDTIIMHLEACLAGDPQDFRAASDLSAMYLRRFERHQEHTQNRINVREIRNTVHSVEFESPQEVAEWLHRAFGEHSADLYRALAMARRAVRGQPVRGETYLILAQVGFLAGLTEAEEMALQEQALRLRPHKATVLFIAGLTHAENGNLELAMEAWRKAFHRDAEVRGLIIRGLVPYSSAQDLIRQLNPDADGLYRVFVEYRAQNKLQDADSVVRYYMQHFDRLVKEPQHGRLFWRNSALLFEYAGQEDLALRCLREAVNENPASYEVRKKLGLLLWNGHDRIEARRHLDWCLRRNASDREITKALGIELTDSLGEVRHEQ